MQGAWSFGSMSDIQQFISSDEDLDSVLWQALSCEARIAWAAGDEKAWSMAATASVNKHPRKGRSVVNTRTKILTIFVFIISKYIKSERTLTILDKWWSSFEDVVEIFSHKHNDFLGDEFVDFICDGCIVWDVSEISILASEQYSAQNLHESCSEKTLNDYQGSRVVWFVDKGFIE